jgi:hypothetical protein
MAFNLFEAPEYYQGLLGEEETKKLQGRAMTTGLVNAAIGYLAQPKTMGYGSALPYIGRALAGGLQSGQETIRSGLQDYETQQKLAEMKRKQGQQQRMQDMLGGITDPNERLFAELAPEQYVASKLKPKERKVEKIGNQIVDVTGDTPNVLFTGEKELKAPPTRERQVGRTKIQEELQADGTWKEIGKGAMDAPQQAKDISYKTETGADGNIYYVPTKPGSPVLDINNRPTNAYKPAGAKPTADERKANTLLTRMEGSLSQLNQALKEDPSAAKPGYFPETVRALSFGAEAPANLVTSGERQRVEAAQTDVIDAALTLGTGAAYTKEQLAGYRKSYFPQIGDTEGQIRDKTIRRENLLNAARIAAGKENQAAPMQNTQQVQPTQAQPIPKVGAEKGGYVFKGGNPNDPNSWIKKGK